MDGLLFNTEPLYFECYKKAAKEKGLTFTEELFEACVGISQADAARLIRHYFGQDFDTNALHARTYAHFEQYLKDGGPIHFRPGAKEAVEFFIKRGLSWRWPPPTLPAGRSIFWPWAVYGSIFPPLPRLTM